MIIDKTFQGAFIISAMVEDGFITYSRFLFTKQYMGYTRAEAIRKFKEDVKANHYQLI